MSVKISLNQKLLLCFLFTLFAALHFFIVIQNHYNFKTASYDYAVYNFAFFDFAHFRSSPCTVYLAPYNISFLQDHFSLTLLIFSPLYWLLNPLFGSYSLLILQGICVMVGAFATYKLILFKAGNFGIALAAMLFYFTLYGRYSAYQADCNLFIIGSAFIPLFLYFFELRRYVLASLTFLFILLTREDFALTLFFLCLTLFILNRKDAFQKRFSLILMLVAALGFIMIFKIFIPMLEDENKKFSLFNYQALGSNPSEAIKFMLTHPLESFKWLFVNHTSDVANDGIKMKFYLVYLLSGGFILVYRPVYFIALIPILTKKMYNDDSLRWGHESYYGAELVSVLPVFVFFIIAGFKNKNFRVGLSVLMVVCSSVVCVYNIITPSPVYYGSNKFNFFNKAFYMTKFNLKSLNDIIKEIPDTARLSSTCAILPHVSAREKAYYFPRIDDAQYVLVSTRDNSYPVSPEEFNDRILQLKMSKDWLLLRNEDDCLLFKRIQ